MDESHNMDISFESNLNDTTRERNSNDLDTSGDSIEPKNLGQLYQKG
jgi:hypothetical protein